MIAKQAVSPCEFKTGLTEIDDVDLEVEDISEDELEEKGKMQSALGIGWDKLREDTKAIGAG